MIDIRKFGTVNNINRRLKKKINIFCPIKYVPYITIIDYYVPISYMQHYNTRYRTSYLKYYVLDYKCVERRKKKIVCNWRQRVDTIVWSIYCLNGGICELSTTQWKTIDRLVYMGFFLSWPYTTHYIWPFLKPSPTKAL